MTTKPKHSPDELPANISFKVFMNELDRHSAFVDCLCNTLYGSPGAHVPRSKQTGMTDLQKERRPRNATVY
jgi:hypothetical protein